MRASIERAPQALYSEVSGCTHEQVKQLELKRWFHSSVAGLLVFALFYHGGEYGVWSSWLEHGSEESVQRKR